MPKWMEEIEGGMRAGGVDNPWALMNSMGIKKGSKTVVGKKEAKRRMASYGRRVGRERRGKVSAQQAGDKMAHSRRERA
jgi:hypothetical protein